MKRQRFYDARVLWPASNWDARLVASVDGTRRDRCNYFTPNARVTITTQHQALLEVTVNVAILPHDVLQLLRLGHLASYQSVNVVVVTSSMPLKRFIMVA